MVAPDTKTLANLADNIAMSLGLVAGELALEGQIQRAAVIQSASAAFASIGPLVTAYRDEINRLNKLLLDAGIESAPVSKRGPLLS